MKVTEAGDLSSLSDLLVAVPAASLEALLQNAPRAVPLLVAPCAARCRGARGNLSLLRASHWKGQKPLPN